MTFEVRWKMQLRHRQFAREMAREWFFSYWRRATEEKLKRNKNETWHISVFSPPPHIEPISWITFNLNRMPLLNWQKVNRYCYQVSHLLDYPDKENGNFSFSNASEGWLALAVVIHIWKCNEPFRCFEKKLMARRKHWCFHFHGYQCKFHRWKMQFKAHTTDKRLEPSLSIVVHHMYNGH